MHVLATVFCSLLLVIAACQTADTPRVSETPVTQTAADPVGATASKEAAAAPPAAATPPPAATQPTTTPGSAVPPPPAAARPPAANEVTPPADVAAIPRDAKRTASGLGYRLLQKGKGGRHPQATSQVLVHYSGWTTDGKRFDSSVVRGSPAKFGVGQLIPGWTEGLQLMSEGEKMRLWVPSKLAYNDAPGMPAGMLVFDVELIQIY